MECFDVPTGDDSMKIELEGDDEEITIAYKDFYVVINGKMMLRR